MCLAAGSSVCVVSQNGIFNIRNSIRLCEVSVRSTALGNPMNAEDRASKRNSNSLASLNVMSIAKFRNKASNTCINTGAHGRI